MNAITIRKLPDGVKQRLRMRAAANDRSMEAEARDILVSALEAPRRVDVTWVEKLMEVGEELGGVDLELPGRESTRPVDLFGAQ